MMRFSTVAYCQDCGESISAYDIIATQQAKRCPTCFDHCQSQRRMVMALTRPAKSPNELSL